MMVGRIQILFVGIAILWGSSSVLAQGGGSEAELLRSSDVLAQLQLSEQQSTRLTEAMKGGSPSTAFFEPYLNRMKQTSDEAERTKIREEMQAAVAKAKEEASGAVFAVLDARQLKLLRSLYIQRSGGRALADARVAGDLALTDDQKKQVAALIEQRREASNAVGFGASEDQRNAFRKEWDDKFLAVLTPEQKGKWDEQSALAAVASAATPAAVQSPPGTPPVAGATTGAPAAMVPEGAEVVSSFGSDTAIQGGEKIEKFSFNFRYAPWDQLLQDFATGAGYTLDLTVTPPGTLSHIDPNEYTATQAMDILNGYLQRKGYTLVVKDGFLVCVNVAKPIPPNLIRDVSVDELIAVSEGNHSIGENEIVRIEIPLEKLDVGVMAQEVEQLLGPLGAMTAFTQTGTLIISDTGSNLRRIKNYIDSSLKKRKEALEFKSYFLKNINVEEAEFMLLAQFGLRQGVTNVSAGGGGDRRGGSPFPSTPAPAAASGIKVFSDTRTNSLLVTASPDEQKLVEEIIKAIDVSEGPDGKPLTREDNTGPFLKVYKVAGRADQVAQSITAMMPGVVVNEDGQAGTVHIFATTRQHETVNEWIQAFTDGTGAAGSVAVIPLVKMDPLTAAATLRNLFVSEGAAAPTIETDLYGNRVIVKGSAAQVELIRKVLLDLGEPGTGVRNKGEGGTIRRYSLRGRDPNEFFQYLQREWESEEKTPIRIVVPPKSGPIRDLKTPSKPEDAPATQERGYEQGGNLNPQPIDPQANSRARRTGSQYIPVRAQDEPAASARIDGIQIVVDGDELLLLSDDEDALDRLEETMDFLQQSVPYRTRWTVFYLQASDATETAALLEQLIPSSSVTSTAADTGFSLGSMFRPITDSVSSMTGLSGIGMNPQTLRIIPDARSNSLFITGPQSAVDEAEKLLEVLDSNDIPESLRELQPRRIEVKYADIDDMATMVNDAFKPYLEPAGGRQQQNNPLAQMFGGGGGGNRNEPQGVQMTIAVDRQTSSLIVSSSEALYAKVSAMVEEQDNAAQKANRTIRVVQLKHADAGVIQQSLTSLLPRVTTSSSRPSSSGNNSSGNSNNGGSNSGDSRSSQPSSDPFQQMMQDRMRQRMGGSGGSSPFGGGMSPFGGGASPFGGGASPFGGGRGGFGGGGFGGGGRGGR